jgi:hypothetical protein
MSTAELDELGIEGLTDAVAVADSHSGRVYRARQPALSRTVAVKLLSEPFHDPYAWERFQQECFAMGMLGGHPNIVQVYDAGFTAEGRSFIIMDYVAGGSLAQRIERTGPLPWRDVLATGVKVAGALATAHEANVAHGDVRPASILMSKYGEPQLTDFGMTGLRLSEKATVAADISDLAGTLLTLLGEERDEVPEAMLDLLAQTRHGPPLERPADAAAFGKALQDLQRALSLPVTRLPVGGLHEHDAAPLADATSSGRRLAGVAAVSVLAVVMVAATIVAARVSGQAKPAVPLLTAAALGEAWTADEGLRTTLRAQPDGHLCNATPAAGVTATHVSAFRAGTPGPRTANVVRTFRPGQAATFMRGLDGLRACLGHLGGLSDIDGESLPIADEAFLVRYRRPTASLPVEVVVIYARTGDVVTGMTQLGYPTADQDLTGTLRRTIQAQVTSRS